MFTKPIFKYLFGAVILNVVAAAMALASTTPQKPSYYVKAVILVGGKIVGTPQIMALANEEDIIEIGGGEENPKTTLRLGVVASDEKAPDGTKAIRLAMDVAYKTEDKSAHTQSTVILRSGHEATITQNAGSPESMEIRVTATRQ